MSEDILVVIGTGALGAASLFTYWVARANGYRRYGREALYAWATLGLMLVLVRVGRDFLGILSAEESFQLASVGYVAHLLILWQIAFVLRRGMERT